MKFKTHYLHQIINLDDMEITPGLRVSHTKDHKSVGICIAVSTDNVRCAILWSKMPF